MNPTPKSLPLPAAERLAGIRRGIEKEGLRVLPSGHLALTPHPAALGSALTHPHITTDYSESQLELITGARLGVDECLQELQHIHQYTLRSMAAVGEEMIWASSMPCHLPTDETIPLGRYGSSHSGRSKSVYRMGLGHRYGRRMQTISGIHYNWSLPGVSSEDYFALIRNFRRHAFVLLYLFGASPALSPCFVEGREHRLQPLGEGCKALYLPHATSLRMGRLGYQSDAQASINVSYNGLEGYANSLHQALTQPYPAYEQLGIRNPGGDYNQLGTSLLQIENEFYGTIRPKRTTRSGERPLHALRERGVEYVEVRLMDLDPFDPLGINTSTMRMLDVFLLHCLLTDSPPDSPEEIAQLKHNQHLAAERGREPGLQLLRGQDRVALVDWAAQVLQECAPMAAALDATHATTAYSEALAQARQRLAQPQTTPSARVLDDMRRLHGNSFEQFGLTQSLWAREHLLGLPWSEAQQAQFAQFAQTSVQAQQAIEAADTGTFEEWRQRYMDPAALG
ncbi:glutamate--cysteine ligase [Comamonas aquatica]|uniref:Glutamate--cysteine ligase n=1 Tax=Comamonas aquatica TaxID=225991 RepID=A0AA42W1D5_9BURK|nr:glutamate--cysteine ligase [Comamonas aquatica]MDE1554969.1 glutamate--cysteine ligase [Comamonas aquatica]MDH1427874.1 glutamate--cysteine ligase [Comamonas aquatica]MDH1606258.1 glutamate--cysteine ligase [Comamonas aquatica]MDH1616451.1 glutamate--cysteine ligase [Comamonas aquatica]MDH1813582.1 glutamate--cysteine ligase [Comamonas aquatica]